MKIAFIGLGAMGYPMAGHLKKEHEVTVWNRTQAVAEKHVAQHGTTLAPSLGACAGAEVIISIVPTSREVDQLVDGLWDELRPGTLWIDATSGDPVTSGATAKRLRTKGVAFVDAPVTGGTPGAEAGTLTVMIGGAADDFARAAAIVKPYAGKVVHVGAVGSGHAIKAINNAMLATNMWAASECFLMAKRFGIDLRTAFDVINSGSGRSNVTENLLPKRVVDGEWPVSFKLQLHDKDVRIAAAMAHEQHLAAPMLALTSQLFTAALENLPEGADYLEVAKYAAAMSGEEW